MSAIAGIYHRDGDAAAGQDLRLMLSAMSYRGPDGTGAWVAGPAAVGALMLWSTPQARFEPLPLVHPAAELAITADARLDNREDLIARLGLPSHPGSAPGDAALILAAYERWGEQAPERLLGDFAFAIWDRARMRFFCARDHFGVKQLYYYCSDRLFAFATEIKALLVLSAVPSRLDETRLGDLLLARADDKEATLYQDIYRLPPATSIAVGAHSASRRGYWQLDPRREMRLSSDAEYAEAYRELLEEAVRCRLRAGGPVGAALSGGLDSSSVACLARDLLAASEEEPPHTFSAVFEAATACDERRYIAAVLERGGVVPHLVRGDLLGPLAGWEAAGQEDEPLWNPQAPLSKAVYQEAGRQGVRVFLEGVGGDYVVGHGLEYLSELALKGRWLKLAGEAISLGRHSQRDPWAIVSGRARMAVPEPLRRLRRKLRGRAGPSVVSRVPLRPDFARRAGLAERVEESAAVKRRAARFHREAQWLSITGGSGPSVSLVFVDRLAASVGIEVRCPFLDRRLAEFCLALPPDQKLRQGWTRWIARQAMAGILPEEVRWRPGKASFKSALDYGMTRLDRPILEDILLREPGPIDDYVDMAEVAGRCRRYLAEPAKEDGWALWRIASLGLWLRRRSQAPSPHRELAATISWLNANLEGYAP